MPILFGFDGEHGSDVRPAHKAAVKAWAKDESAPGANDGTRLTAAFANVIVANLRHLASAYGVTGPESNDDLLTQAVVAAINDIVDGKIDDLKATAPELLDTLDELAAALGDDANFAATVTTALAGKVATSRTISASGLASGGGDLSANRTITVTAASQAEAEEGVSSTVAMTPQRTAQAIAVLAPIALSANQNYKHRMPGASGLLSGEEGVAFDFLTRDAIINDYADTLSNVGKPDALLTVTRASTKMVVNRNRLLASVSSNVLAYDHDPMMGVAKGALFEPAATNLFQRSEEFDNAFWAKSGAAITADAVVAPDGLTTADTLVENTATATPHSITRSPVTIAANTPHTLSVFIKAGAGTRYLRLQVDVNSSTSGFRAIFDPSAGTISLAAASFGTGSAATARITPYPNGWYRCEISGIADASSTSATFSMFLQTVNNSFNATYDGDGASSMTFWGAQLEAGPVATSYIPTTSATVTRAADAVSLATTAFPLNAAQGTMLADFSMVNAAPPANMGILTLTDGTTSNGYFISQNSAGTRQAFILNATATQASVVIAAGSANVVSKIAMAWAANDAAIYTDGALTGTDGSVNLPTVSSLRFGEIGGGSSHMHGHLRRVAYISRRMTNAELQAMTA